ncbi:MAG: patatin-like phospholipase family protein [bacterium]
MSFILGCAAPRPAVYTGIPFSAAGRPKVALVLGGGAARGFAHIGVIRVLERERIPIDMIVGTSVGSLIGAIYASNADSFELEWIAFSLEKEDIFDFSLFSSKTGPVKGDKLEAFVNDHISVRNIEEFSIPYYAVATNLNTGEAVVFDKGPVAKAVRASSSIPGVFTPLMYEGTTLVDGGVLGNLAPEIARQRGADIVIAVDIGKNVVNQDTSNVIDIILQAISIMSNKIDSYKQKDADVLIAPSVGDVGMMDFTRKKECMIAGMEAAREAIPAIQALLIPPQPSPKDQVEIPSFP